MIRILIHGICGQMGRALVEAANAQSGLYSVVAGVDCAPVSSEISVPVYPSCDAVKEAFDVLIDFSVASALPSTLQCAEQRRVPIVIGTTGLTEQHLKLLRGASEQIPVFQTGNMSLGVNLQLDLIRQAKAALGSGFDVEIIERHHRRKVDAPSGTGLMLANCIQAETAGGSELVFGRHETNKRRTDAEIGMHSVRGGTIVGEHEVLFIGRDEVVEINHRAYSKQVFAVGALRAASYVFEKQNGLYDMHDVVSENNVASHVLVTDEQAIISVGRLPMGGDLPARVLSLVATENVPIDMISMNIPAEQAGSLSFSVAARSLSVASNALLPLIAEQGVTLRTESGMAKVTIEGSGMPLKCGVAAELLGILAQASISVHLITTSETKIELCVSASQAARAVAKIETHFLKRQD